MTLTATVPFPRLAVSGKLSNAAGYYRRSIELGGTPNDVEAFIAADTLVTWIDAHPPTGVDMQAFRANVEPYLSHLAGLIESAVTTSTGTSGRIILTVK